MIKTCSIKLSLNSLWALRQLLPSALVCSTSQDSSIRNLVLHKQRQLNRYILFVALICVFLTFPSIVSGYIIAPQEIEVDSVWTKNSGPYVVLWPITIPTGVTLTIEPGTVVALQGAPFEVFGTLKIGQPAQIGTSTEKVFFTSVLASGVTSPEIDTPSETGDLTLAVTGGSVEASDFRVDGHMSLYGNDAHVEIKNADIISGNSIIKNHTQLYFEGVNIDRNDFMVIQNMSSISMMNSFIVGGYINIVSTSTLSFSSTTLSDMSEIRIFDGSIALFENLIYNGGEGFLVKNRSKLEFKKSRLEDIVTDTAFSIAKQSHVLFEHSSIKPFFSDFALILDGSTLSATSTQITHILQRGIQAIRGTTISLYDVTMDHILSLRSTDNFFVELVGSSLSAVKSSFSDVSGNGIEMYSSNTVPYSSIRMTDSRISDFGKSGIYAVRGTGTIQHSVFDGGSIGIEHIFSYLNITNSSIIHTTEFGAVAYILAYPLIANNNYWGDVSGPYHVVKNAQGLGDMISDNVLFTPWLSKDPTLPCCSNVLFIPGLMASRLYKPKPSGGETTLWEPKLVGGGLINQLFLDGDGKSIRDDVYTRDVIDEALTGYVGPNIYKSFIGDMNALKTSGVLNDWKPIPYDWRLSLDDILQGGTKTDVGMSYHYATASPYILEEVKRMADTSKTGRVTLVAHSNGGLLAKALLLQLRDIGLEYLIDTLILVAVPQVGTPQAIGALLHGFGQGIPEQAPFLAPPYLMRILGQNMPGAYSLLPSLAYFNSVTDPVIVFDKTTQTPGRAIATSTQLSHFLGGFEYRIPPQVTDLSTPTILNRNLLAQAADMHARIDTWIPPADIDIFQIAGWGMETVKGIQYSQSIKKGKKVTRYQPLFTEEGDQTVVVPSALDISTTTPNIKRFWLNLAEINNFKIVKRSHADIFELPEIRNTIKDIVTHNFSDSDSLTSSLGTTSPIAKKGKKLQFFLHSETLAMDMYDAKGNHTGVSTTTGEVEENVADSTYRLFGNVVYISIPEDTVIALNDASIPNQHRQSSVRLIIRNPAAQESDLSTRQSLESDDTYTLDVVEVGDDEAATSTSFTDIPVATTTVSTMYVPESFAELVPISVDTDNDGTVDFEVEPGEIVPYVSPDPIHVQIQSEGSRSGGRARRVVVSNATTTKSTVQKLIPVEIVQESTPITIQKPTTTISVVPLFNTEVRIQKDQTAAVFNAFSENKMGVLFSMVVTKIKLLYTFLLEIYSK